VRSNAEGTACNTLVGMDPAFTDPFLVAVQTAATTDPQAILHTVYGAIIQGDFDTFSESLTEDVEMSVCGFGPMDGTWKGRKEVVEATRRNFSLVASQQPEIEGMIAQGDSVAILLRETGTLRATGENYRIRAVQWFTFAGGKLKRIDEVAASLAK